MFNNYKYSFECNTKHEDHKYEYIFRKRPIDLSLPKRSNNGGKVGLEFGGI